ncbi:hypothetical protein AVEN_82374-2-1, partial [Araneus ventricosus]
SHTCVQKTIGKFKSDLLVENKSGRGRKSIPSDVAERKILKEINIIPKASAVKLATETSQIIGRNVSAETVRNVIRQAGYKSRVARKKQFTSLQNQKKRLEFAKTHGGGSVIVWSCMASTRAGNLVFIDGIMNHMVYLDILHNSLKESAKNLGLDENFIFQHDNDPKHTAILDCNSN